MLNEAEKQYYQESYPELKPFIDQVDAGSVNFLMDHVVVLPLEHSFHILKAYFDKPIIRERNLFIRKLKKSIFSKVPTFVDNINFYSIDIRKWAAYQSRKFSKLANEFPYTYTGKSRTKSPYRDKERERKSLYKVMSSYTKELNVEPPEPDGQQTLEGCIQRLQCPEWWARRIRKSLKQAREYTAITLGRVSRGKDIYCSSPTVKDRELDKLRNEKFLKDKYVVNEEGEVLSLFEISQSTIANPVNRRADLMTRASGFEKMADEDGYQGVFVTITCPSKYHNNYSKSGKPNPNWGGYTPKESQKYLNSVWCKIRAQLKRDKITMFGIRVTEPQHDGTPHWHILVFILPTDIKRFSEIIAHYALMEDGDEKGAAENRYDIKIIDKTKGRATGYLAKYVSKNIDGVELETGSYEEPIETTVRHVEAWASCWSIRQFQQQGGASASVYRELRRARHEQAPDSPFEAARAAADTGNWAEYNRAMGEIDTPRKDHKLKLDYEVKFDTDTGEISTTRYDGDIQKKLIGVKAGDQRLKTRHHVWRPLPKGAD